MAKQKQLLFLLAIALFGGCQQAFADNPLIHTHNKESLHKGGGVAAHQTIRAGQVNHHMVKRPEKQANRFMREEHMSSPMTPSANNTHTAQQDKYAGVTPKKKGWW